MKHQDIVIHPSKIYKYIYTHKYTYIFFFTQSPETATTRPLGSPKTAAAVAASCRSGDPSSSPLLIVVKPQRVADPATTVAMAKLGWLARQAAAQPPFSHARRQPLTASFPFLAHDGDGNRRRWRREEAGSESKREPTVAGEDVAAAAVRGIRRLLEMQRQRRREGSGCCWRPNGERERETGGGEMGREIFNLQNNENIAIF